MSAVAKKLDRLTSTEIVLRRLQTYASLDGAAVELLRSLEERVSHPAGSELGSARTRMVRPVFVLSGWAARVRWLADGRRQILEFILPGDAVGLCLRPEPIAGETAVAITELQTVDASPVLRAMASPAPPGGLIEALRIAAAMDQALLIDQVVRLGRQSAYERICHLLLELCDRLAEVGLSRRGHFSLPLTQETLADATGLSVVHVNRILQQLRREQRLDLRGGRAALMDIDRLRMAADYRRVSPSAWAAGGAGP